MFNEKYLLPPDGEFARFTFSRGWAHLTDHGYSLLLFPQLRQTVELELPTLLAHKLGNMVYPELAQVDAKAQQAETFSANLPPLPTRPHSPAPALPPAS